jgi:hypothetical protein
VVGSPKISRLLEGEVVLDPRDDEVVVFLGILYGWVEVFGTPSCCGSHEEVRSQISSTESLKLC